VLKVKAPGKHDLVPAVGHVASISAGEFIHARRCLGNGPEPWAPVQGRFSEDHASGDGGRDRKISWLRQVRGIGPRLGERIVAAFGEATFEAIEADSTRLREVSAIGEFRADRIAAGWAEQKAVRDIMVFLHSHGVGTSRAVRIFKTYGHDATKVMTEDPYRLARDIRGIGFRTADAIAIKLGMTRESPQRCRLEFPSPCGKRPMKAIADTIDGRSCVFLRSLYLAERGVADRLHPLAKGPPPWPMIDIEKAIPWVEKKTGKRLAASQRAAIKMVLRSKAAVVTGGPGVGKTTLLDDPADSRGQGNATSPRNADRPRREAHDRRDWN
jgi:exodeoxyribonuclease V alpha subunit